MKFRFLSAIGLLAPLAVGGCSTYSLMEPNEAPIAAFGPSSTPAATVCVIRPSHWGLAVTFVVHDDSTLVGATKGESYFCYLAEPGPHRVVSSRADSNEDFGQVTFHAEAGKRYWLHQGYDSFFGTVLDWVDETRAHPMVEACSYKELVDAPSEEALPTGVPYAHALTYGADND